MSPAQAGNGAGHTTGETGRSHINLSWVGPGWRPLVAWPLSLGLLICITINGLDGDTKKTLLSGGVAEIRLINTDETLKQISHR